MVAAVAKSDSCDESDSARLSPFFEGEERLDCGPSSAEPQVDYCVLADVHLEASGMAAHENVGPLIC
jgi:hypothetical protein